MKKWIRWNISLAGNADVRRKIRRNGCPSVESGVKSIGGAGRAEQLSHCCCSETRTLQVRWGIMLCDSLSNPIVTENVWFGWNVFLQSQRFQKFNSLGSTQDLSHPPFAQCTTNKSVTNAATPGLLGVCFRSSATLTWGSNILMAMTSHDKWYQKIDGIEKPLVQRNS
jgi:hypothetical protein